MNKTDVRFNSLLYFSYEIIFRQTVNYVDYLQLGTGMEIVFVEYNKVRLKRTNSYKHAHIHPHTYIGYICTCTYTRIHTRKHTHAAIGIISPRKSAAAVVEMVNVVDNRRTQYVFDCLRCFCDMHRGSLAWFPQPERPLLRQNRHCTVHCQLL